MSLICRTFGKLQVLLAPFVSVPVLASVVFPKECENILLHRHRFS